MREAVKIRKTPISPTEGVGLYTGRSSLYVGNVKGNVNN